MYLNKMIMNRLFHTCKQLIGVAALSVGLYACDWIHDDSLPLCEFRLYFKYDYNMKFADAFQHEVDFVTLFFCDQEGNFLFQRRIEKSELDERNSIALDMEPGTYQVVTWAGWTRAVTHGTIPPRRRGLSRGRKTSRYVPCVRTIRHNPTSCTRFGIASIPSP